MEINKKKSSLHITFHNPNSPENTTKFLTKIIAQELCEHYLYKQCLYKENKIPEFGTYSEEPLQ